MKTASFKHCFCVFRHQNLFYYQNLDHSNVLWSLNLALCDSINFYSAGLLEIALIVTPLIIQNVNKVKKNKLYGRYSD